MCAYLLALDCNAGAVLSQEAERSHALLLVANYDSSVGYAWWLMESYWVTLAWRYRSTHAVLLSYPSVSRLPQAVADAPLEVVEAPFASTNLGAVWEQLRFIRLRRIRVVYFSDQEIFHWRYLLYRMAGVRLVVVHDHTPGVRTRPRPWLRLLKRLVHAIPWCSANVIIGATEFLRDRHIHVACAPPRKCFVVPNGIGGRVSRIPSEDVRDRFGIPKQRKVVVGSGRAHKVKGVSFALRCLRELIRKRSRLDVHFLYCGSGPHLQEFIEEARALDIADHVTFAGNQDLSSFLASCDIAFHPSKAEVGYSLSILEYMQAALPVVVPDNPSVCGATISGRTGLVYKEGDVGAAADSIEQLLDNSERARKMGMAGSELVASEYSLDRAHSALVEVFEAVDPRLRIP